MRPILERLAPSVLFVAFGFALSLVNIDRGPRAARQAERAS